MSAREVMLARIRSALAGQRAQPAPAVGYRVHGERDRDAVVELFVERVREYRATVLLTGDLNAAVAEVLAAAGASRVGIAADLDLDLRLDEVDLVPDVGLSSRDLDALDGALTTCAAGCAETGTIALDGGPGQGRRALSLVPDLHVCVIRADDIVETVPELVARLEPSAREGRPLVLVSGPSATSDIELNRVEGVHGPRRLAVVVLLHE
ncbi:MAG: LUD domain-containing protein [Gaiellales bacterium]